MIRRILAALALTAVTLTSGCFLQPPTFQWQNEYGRQCFYQCKRDFFACRTSCYGYNTNGVCHTGCAEMEYQCDRGCPGLHEVVQR
jgi:hypothetical protein